MKKGKDISSEDTQVTEDFEAFEEWEKASPEGPAAEEAAPPPHEEPIIPEGEEEFPGLEEPPEAPQATERKPGARAAASEPGAPAAARSLADELAELAPDVPVNLVAVIGKTTTNVGDLIKYRIGQVIDLGRAPGETVDVVANGRLIARGELVDMDGKMGVRVLKMVR